MNTVITVFFHVYAIINGRCLETVLRMFLSYGALCQS